MRPTTLTFAEREKLAALTELVADANVGVDCALAAMTRANINLEDAKVYKMAAATELADYITLLTKGSS